MSLVLDMWWFENAFPDSCATHSTDGQLAGVGISGEEHCSLSPGKPSHRHLQDLCCRCGWLSAAPLSH